MRIKSQETLFLESLAHTRSRKYFLAKVCGVIFAVSLIVQSWAFARVFSDMALQGSFSIHIAVIGLFALLIRAICNYGKEQICTSASRDIRYKLRTKLIAHLTHLGPARLDIEEDGALSLRVYEQIDALDDFFSRYKPQVFMVVFIPFVILATVACISWVTFTLFIVTAPLVIIFMIFVGHKAAQANRRQFSVLAMLSNQFIDLNQGLVELKRLNKTHDAKARLADSASAYKRTTMGVLGLAFLSTATLELFSSLAIAMVAVYLGLGLLEILPWQVGVSPLSLTQAMFLLLLAPEFYLPLRQLGNDYHAKQKAETAAKDILVILDTPLKKTRVKNTTPTGVEGLGHNTSKSCPFIDFHEVSWEQSGRYRLTPISAQVTQGERVWLSGESGIGKSSLLHLLLGFEYGFQGQLNINGVPFDNIDLAHWRTKLAWLPQTPEWVNGSIRRNLLLGIPTPTEDAIQSALEQSQSNHFIQTLPQGVETKITELGTGLSGGQMQRLSIARALLSDADMWLLDEPCSGLDEATANDILATIELVSKQKTLIIVSHDTHPIPWADKHWVLTSRGLHE